MVALATYQIGLECSPVGTRPDPIWTLANNSVDCQPWKSDLRINLVRIRYVSCLNAALSTWTWWPVLVWAVLWGRAAQLRWVSRSPGRCWCGEEAQRSRRSSQLDAPATGETKKSRMKEQEEDNNFMLPLHTFYCGLVQQEVSVGKKILLAYWHQKLQSDGTEVGQKDGCIIRTGYLTGNMVAAWGTAAKKKSLRLGLILFWLADVSLSDVLQICLISFNLFYPLYFGWVLSVSNLSMCKYMSTNDIPSYHFIVGLLVSGLEPGHQLG